jgi:formylglycine-generating enzyme required for sulfatase activity
MGKYEVTFDQYDKYCGETNKSKPSDQGWGREKRPVIYVSWNDASAFCQWMIEKTGLKFKLPSEAQWEKAARGTDGREYPWGNQEPDDKLANFSSNINKTTPVGSYPDGASLYGLLDMAGNVLEWCYDWYGSYRAEYHENPTGPKSGTIRVIRGGCYVDRAARIRCAFRDPDPNSPSTPYTVVGFRLCQDNH